MESKRNLKLRRTRASLLRHSLILTREVKSLTPILNKIYTNDLGFTLNQVEITEHRIYELLIRIKLNISNYENLLNDVNV